jgi:prenyltransferase beta subunit
MGEQTSGSSQSPDAIEAEIAETRAHLAGTIDELAVRARPTEIARRQATSAKARFIEATHTPEGDLRVERVGAVAAGAAVLLALAILHLRHHIHRHRRRRRG